MKKLTTILLVFWALQSQAQTYTTAKLSSYIRDQWKANDSLRKANATLQAKLDMKDTRDDERNAQIKKLNDKLDSAALYLSTTDFIIDPNTKTVSIINKPDTFVRVQSAAPVATFATFPAQPMHDLTGLTSNDPAIDNLKWQVQQYEKLLDERERVIDKLQKIIKNQNNKIAKLTKKP